MINNITSKKLFINILIFVIGLFLLLMQTQAHAGQNCEASALDKEATTKALNLSASLLNIIKNYGDDNNVFLIARKGQNLDEYNQKYSHGAFVFKKENDWVLMHVLNTCASDESSVYQDGIGNFFIDSMYKYESVISAFGAKESEKLKAFLLNTENAKKTHIKKYNMLSHPYSTKYQNSNGWLIESFFAANFNIEPTNRDMIHRIMKEQGFIGQTLTIDPIKRLGARVTKANIAFDDQPFADRMNNKIVTTTYDNMLSFFSQKGWITKTLYLE